MNKNIFILLYLFISTTAGAQYSLTGKIIDAKTQEGLPGVNVIIENTHLGTVTDFNGYFKLENIPQKHIQLIFTYEGYQTEKRTLNFDQKTKNLVVPLKETAFELDEVIVSTGVNKLQKDNVMKVSHRSLQAMERNGIQSLMQGVSQIPGVKSLNTGTGIEKPVIRGLTGNRVLVFNQGVKMENYQFGEAHGMGIDPAGISGVEVIKGPASLLYGSDALGGVLYLIPEKYAPKNQTKADLKAQYFSNTQGFHTSIGAKSSLDQWRFLARASYGINGEYQIPDGKRVFNSANNSQDLKLGIGQKHKNRQTNLRYNFNLAQNGIPLYTVHKNIAYQPEAKYQDIKTHNVSLKNNFDFETARLQTNLGYSNVRRALIHQQKSLIDMQLQTISLDAKYYFPDFKDLEVIAGTQADYQQNNNFGLHHLLPDAQILNVGIFSTAYYQIKQHVFQGGIRFDYRHIQTQETNDGRPALNKSLHSLTGAFGYKTSWMKNMNLRFNIASGFRAPNLAELTSNGEHENRIEIGNPDLKNEQNIQADINWDYQSTHIEFFINGFYNQIYNYIYLAPTMQALNMLPVYQYQQHDAYLYGGEAGLHFHPHPWDWLHYKSSFETVIGKKQNGEYLPLIPADTWKNELRFTNKHKHKSLQRYYWSWQLNKTFASRNNPGEDAYPGYSLLNTALGAEFKFGKSGLNLSVAVHNLMNTTYISNLSVLRERNIPNQGRNIIFSLKLFL